MSIRKVSGFKGSGFVAKEVALDLLGSAIFFDWRCGRWEKIVQMKTTGVQQVKWQSDRLSGRLAARRTQVFLRQRCNRFSVCKASTGRANDLLWQMFNISKKVAQFPCVATWGLAGFLNLFPICGDPL